MTAQTAPELYRMLKGVFAVYKQAGTGINLLADNISKKLLSDLHSLEQRPQKSLIQYLPVSSNKSLTTNSHTNYDSNASLAEQNLSLFERVPTNVNIDWFDHPLVQGPRYTDENILMHFGHTLDWLSSGIQLVGLHAKGKSLLAGMAKLHLPRSYLLRGRFGQASTQFDGEGRIVERSTWDHISETKIMRLLSMMQGTYRNALIKSSNLDLNTQYAYEMASKGLLRPDLPTGPMVLDLKLKELDLPNFVVDVTCISESSMYLRKLVHEIGLELKSSAVCMEVHRYRDAIFFVEDESTLLTRDITAEKVVNIISENAKKISPVLKNKPSVFQSITNPVLTEEDAFKEQ